MFFPHLKISSFQGIQFVGHTLSSYLTLLIGRLGVHKDFGKKGNLKKTDLENAVESEMVKVYPDYKKYKDGWGVFLVNGKKINYEIWNTSTG